MRPRRSSLFAPLAPVLIASIVLIGSASIAEAVPSARVTRVSPGLRRAAVQRVVAQSAGVIHECGRAYPTPARRVSVAFDVALTRTAESVVIRGRSGALVDTTAACVQRAVAAWQFPPEVGAGHAEVQFALGRSPSPAPAADEPPPDIVTQALRGGVGLITAGAELLRGGAPLDPGGTPGPGPAPAPGTSPSPGTSPIPRAAVTVRVARMDGPGDLTRADLTRGFSQNHDALRACYQQRLDAAPDAGGELFAGVAVQNGRVAQRASVTGPAAAALTSCLDPWLGTLQFPSLTGSPPTRVVLRVVFRATRRRR